MSDIFFIERYSQITISLQTYQVSSVPDINRLCASHTMQYTFKSENMTQSAISTKNRNTNINHTDQDVVAIQVYCIVFTFGSPTNATRTETRRLKPFDNFETFVSLNGVNPTSFISDSMCDALVFLSH